MSRFAYVNGRYVRHRDAAVHIEDRGYQLADGIYEVIGVHAGRLLDEDRHLDRMDRSLAEIRLDRPVSG
jgi:D-alanine transaminase